MDVQPSPTPHPPPTVQQFTATASPWRRVTACCAGLLLGGVSVVVGCRAADVDGITPVPQLLAFLPWLLVPAGLALVLAGVARWRVGVLWALVALAVTGWFVQPYGAQSSPGRGPVVAELRVLTANVEFGGATTDLVEAIRREKPELVYVQECEYTCSSALAREIPKALYPYRRVVDSGGAEGSAILSTLPLRPAPGIASTLAMPGAVARIGDRDVRLQLAHPLPPVPGGVDSWRTELAALRAYAADIKHQPAIVAGDFNASQDHAAFRAILDAGGLRDSAAVGGAFRTPSWPSGASRIGTQIDHVLTTDDFSIRSARFLTLSNTDHRALLVELELHRG
ncbi:endonuclease/exonuclease/phosphatase family protein [Streptomyces sp. A5-4]|uniref:endonuclease/exonuclease/phosphatase family protein n=1 Tax=Streptomyces sp. A5-4 TaxID=3384771 RepID=UPI003DA89408